MTQSVRRVPRHRVIGVAGRYVETSPNFFLSTSYPSAPAHTRQQGRPQGQAGLFQKKWREAKGARSGMQSSRLRSLPQRKRRARKSILSHHYVHSLGWGGGTTELREKREARFPGKGVEVPPSQNTLRVFTCKVGTGARLVWAEGLRRPLPQVSHRSG